jgi:segregation and condensation protein A
MLRYLKNILKGRASSDPISATELFEKQRSRRAMICLFLAILELVKLQAIVLTQKDAFGDIGLKKRHGFDAVLEESESLIAIEREYAE